MKLIDKLAQYIGAVLIGWIILIILYKLLDFILTYGGEK
jgi:hypothetical protein